MSKEKGNNSQLWTAVCFYGARNNGYMENGKIGEGVHMVVCLCVPLCGCVSVSVVLGPS